MSEATEKLEELINALPRMSRRLSFSEKCAAYFALDRGFAQSLVAKAFRISSGAASALANCRNGKGDGRYATIADEYDRLGREAFGEKYFTDEHITKLQRWRLGAETDADRAAMHGPDPRPGRWGNKIFTLEGYGNHFVTCVVSFRSTQQDMDAVTHEETLPAGWAWRYLDENEIAANRVDVSVKDCPPWSKRRWPTPARAVDGCYESHGAESQRLHPDWPNVK
jgi:hypothetical protein